jgi:threonine/homoserine/homoserine lactone efflux protein
MSFGIMSFGMSLETYLAFIAACLALALLPGPVVTLLIANGLRHGTRAALTNLAGVQVGLYIFIVIVALGLSALMATMGYWFDWVRLAGAAYLVWLGYKLLREPAALGATNEPAPPPRGGFFLQGFIVVLANPKVLVFFGAFIPQFVDMNGDKFTQVMVLGVTFNVIAGLTDALYAVAAGGARRWFSAKRARIMSRVSGLFLIGGGVWLALMRSK